MYSAGHRTVNTSPFNIFICIACIISGALTLIGGFLWSIYTGASSKFAPIVLSIYFM